MEILRNILLIIFILIQGIVAIYLLIPFLITSLYLIKKTLIKGNLIDGLPIIKERQFEFAIIITAHEETSFIPPLVDSILKQKYQAYKVYIVADACKEEMEFADKRIKVLYPETALNSKIKSIDYAINRLSDNEDAIIILDADNLLHPHFLHEINRFFQKGYKVVQADFKPKNTDTSFARMDALSDIFNFFIEREARMELNLSAAIWGSGIAIETRLYKQVVYHNFLGGFDKRLQLHLIRKVKKIGFAKKAVLYDEKISSGGSLQKQRTRWISAQFSYFKENVQLFLHSISRFNFDKTYYALIAMRPPLFLLLGSALIFLVFGFFLNKAIAISWMIILGIFFLSFILTIRINTKDNRYLLTLIKTPLFFFRQMGALFQIKKAKKSFLKTKHTKVVYIDEILSS